MLDVFFPAGDQSRTAPHVASAKKVCARCQVVTECLASAIATFRREQSRSAPLTLNRPVGWVILRS